MDVIGATIFRQCHEPVENHTPQGAEDKIHHSPNQSLSLTLPHSSINLASTLNHHVSQKSPLHHPSDHANLLPLAYPKPHQNKLQQ